MSSPLCPRRSGGSGRDPRAAGQKQQFEPVASVSPEDRYGPDESEQGEAFVLNLGESALLGD